MYANGYANEPDSGAANGSVDNCHRRLFVVYDRETMRTTVNRQQRLNTKTVAPQCVTTTNENHRKRPTAKAGVAGSNPAGGTYIFVLPRLMPDISAPADR
jgi:hypothetical protein